MPENGAEKAIRAHYETYIDTFNKGDAAGVADLFSFPAMFTGADRQVIKVPDRETYRIMMEDLLRQIRSAGWAYTRIEKLDVTLTAGNTAVLTSDYCRYRENGSVLERGRAHYVLFHSGDGWSTIAAIAG